MRLDVYITLLNKKERSPIVDLLPGIKMRSASLFIGSPGSTILKFTPGCSLKDPSHQS